ncbi:MAG: phosphotransferase family protein [Microscillaceae bacterium]|nr:phosphotransferase family protein [Microscillaceae bacterium]
MSKSDLTHEVRKGEELPEEKLRQFLYANELIGDKNAELSVSQFSGGHSNLTYLIKSASREFVLRRPPFGAVKRGHDMGREYKVLSRLHQVFPKAPQAIIYTEDVNVLGAPFYLMEKVDGIILTLKEAKARHIPPADFQQIMHSWLDTFVELHTVDYEAAGLADLGKPEGYVARQVTNWGQQYLQAATDDIPTAQKVMDWMEKNQPTEYGFSLIHNDYKYDNIVFKDDQWTEVKAVLDWEMCTLGHPLMDLGTSISYWVVPSDAEMLKQGLPTATLMPGNPKRSEIIELYAQKTGRSIDNPVFYYAYGLFKLAVIVQQIYYRYKHGYTQDERFAHFNKAAEIFCNTAWQAIQKNEIDKVF